MKNPLALASKWLSLLAPLVLATACSTEQPDYIKSITAEELKRKMQNEDIFLVDVHTPQQKHIKGTDLFVPFDEIGKHLNRFPADKNTPIYLYCESGRMANIAAKALHDSGYGNLTNLEGGEKAWRKNGFELE